LLGLQRAVLARSRDQRRERALVHVPAADAAGVHEILDLRAADRAATALSRVEALRGGVVGQVQAIEHAAWCAWEICGLADEVQDPPGLAARDARSLPEGCSGAASALSGSRRAVTAALPARFAPAPSVGRSGPVMVAYHRL